MFGKYLLPIVLLSSVILFSSVIKRFENFADTHSHSIDTPGRALQGRHQVPYRDLVDMVKKNKKNEKKQSKHIEDIRKVLADTITHLKKDDVLPSGSHCSCASAPVIDPLTGEADLTEGCKPPGWLRMMNSRNAKDEECDN